MAKCPELKFMNATRPHLALTSGPQHSQETGIWQVFLTWHYLVEGEPFPGMPGASLYICSKSTWSNTSALPFGLYLLTLFECKLPERDATMLTCQGRRDRHYSLVKQPSIEKTFWMGKSPRKSSLLCLEMLKDATSVGGQTYLAQHAPLFLHPRYSHNMLSIFPAPLAPLNAICTN